MEKIKFYANTGELMIHDRIKSSANPKTKLKACSAPIGDFYFVGRNSENDFVLVQKDSSGNYLITGHDYQIVGDESEANKNIEEFNHSSNNG